MIAIKAGGSIITRVGDKPVFSGRAVSALASALASLREPFVLVHGSGSFGKPPAGRYGYLSGRIRPGQAPVELISASLLSLHSRLVAELARAGVKAVSCPGRSLFSLSGGRPRLKARPELEEWLRRGFRPVINSDIFPAPGGGFEVVSSDAILCAVASFLHAELAVFLTASPGVIGPDGRTLPSLDRRSLRALLPGMPPSPRDVSGGMRGKLLEISRLLPRVSKVAVLDGRDPRSVLGARTGAAVGTYISF